ncbi:hypothetical protein SAMN02745664_12229 [Moraxella cuniculi DSM 21768]|uniref:Pyridoxal phosphate homeostasis protein n=1 Tax=Moraxella cuniculi DSM 21768 TaxID=1122245 RepID=A0A1N7G2X2_9GAMM|nr:YggS family pyridoxal phosphate-dependent enzyme [Moraxella cuniculi]OOS05141.1 YggS family pyridoxal phosphate enzyme [Moraxella cuniculi]SIS06959.1 hypothetical protein SAMN02745664_12229 [Moraxella cuniculi DSM 21768]
MTTQFDKKKLIDNYKNIKNLLNTANQTHKRGNAARLIAVSKTKPAAMVAALFSEGQVDFGENYLQEAITKIDELSALDITWHYIGSIQRNKTRDIAKYFDWVHTLEREVIATRLNEQREGMPPLQVLIQVNIDNEASKSGCCIEQLPALIEAVSACQNLTLRGLMVLPSKEGGDAFMRTKALFDEMATRYALPHWDSISMGMSGDMDEAVAHGSTMVRIGTAIFGER